MWLAIGYLTYCIACFPLLFSLYPLNDVKFHYEPKFQTKSYPLDVFDDGTYATLVIPAGTLPAMKGKEILYICLKAGKTSPFLHQGTHKSLQVTIFFSFWYINYNNY